MKTIFILAVFGALFVFAFALSAAGIDGFRIFALELPLLVPATVLCCRWMLTKPNESHEN